MKKLFLATAVVALFTACHSTTESEIITSDSLTISDSVTTTSVFDKTGKDTIIIDTIKK